MTDSEEERRTRPFADVLLELQRGASHREASNAFQELVEAVVATGKPGTFALQIKVSKSKASGMVDLADVVRVKLPDRDRSVSMFFVDAEMNLVRDDPRQLELPVGPVRVADSNTERAAQ